MWKFELERAYGRFRLMSDKATMEWTGMGGGVAVFEVHDEPGNFVGRIQVLSYFGGEVVYVLDEGTNPTLAKAIAEDLRQAIEQEQSTGSPPPWFKSVS